MTNELKNVPELRFPEFEGEWEEKRLKDISKINPKYEDSFPSEFNYIDLESVKKGKIYKISRYTMHNAPSRAQRVAKQGDIFFQTVRPYQQNNFVFVDDSYPTVVSTGYAQLRSNLNPSYLDNLLLTTSFLNKVLVKCTGSNYPAINSSDLSNIQLKITSNINEQQKIGEFFSKLDRQIELGEQKLEKLEEQKKGYMQKIFSQELRFKDENGNEYSKWEEVKLQNIANIKKGEQIKKENIDNNGKYYHLNGGTTASNRTNLFNTNPFTISISEGGNSCGFIKMNKEYFFSGGHNYTLLDLSVSNFYLYAYLKYHEKKIMSLRVGSGLPNIQKKDISNYFIKIPSKEEQEKIGIFFLKFDELIDTQRKKIEVLKKQKNGFLQKMFG